MTDAAHRRTLLLCLGIVYFIWGGSYVATSVGIHAAPPFAFAGVRFTIGGAVLFAFARSRRPRTIVTIAEWRNAATVALGTVLLSNGCNVWGMQYVASSQAALLNTTSAFWIALLGMFGARRHALEPRAAFGLLIGFAGAVLIIWPRAAGAHANGSAGTTLGDSILPQLVILAGCLGWASSTIFMRNMRSSLDLLTFTGLQLFCGGLMLLALALARDEFALWVWSWPAFAAMLYLMLLSSCVAYAAFAWLAQNATPAQTGSYGLVNPAVAAVLGWLALGERLTGMQVSGMVIILVGVALVNWRFKERGTAAASGARHYLLCLLRKSS